MLNAFKEFGIILFLGMVGLSSGAGFFPLVSSMEGVKLIGLGVLITVIPLLVVGIFMRGYKKMNYLTLCGTLSGSTTNLPSMTFILNMAGTDAAPLGYSSVYPLTLTLRILTVQAIALALF